MIYTFTPNPAIDYFVNLDEFKFGEINKAKDYYFVAAGKGINCSCMMSILGVESVAIYFSGGFTGKYIDERMKNFEHVRSHPISVSGTTRVNIKFIGESDTAINFKGPSIDQQAKQELTEFIKTTAKGDVLIISGSLPDSYTKEDVLEVCKIASDQGVKLVLDVPGFTLDELKDIKLELIKPNLDEFKELIGKDVTKENYRPYVEQMVGENIKRVLLSLGKDGSYYCGPEGSYQIKVPNIVAYSPVGAGDCTLASFVATMEATQDIEKSLKVANAAGVARVKYGRIQKKERVEELISQIELVKE